MAGQLLTTEKYAYSKQEFAQFIKAAETYGVWACYGGEAKTGRVGFAREGRTYTWDYVMPRGQWVEFKIVGEDI